MGVTTTNLKKYIAPMNSYHKAGITFPITQSDVDKIILRLEESLSPENLCMDGEITPAQAAKRHSWYMTIYRELVDYCKAHNLIAHNLRV